MHISSPTNPRVKRVVALKESRERKAAGLTVVDGIQEILAAAAAGVPLEELYVSAEFLSSRMPESDLQKLSAVAKDVFDVSKAVFEKMAFGNRREGLVAVFRPQLKRLKDLCLRDNPLIVVVDHIEKPGNLGAILRSCDGAGVDFLCVCDGLTDIFNPHVIRSSLGTVFSLAVVEAGSQEIREYLKQHRVKIYAASPNAKTLYTQVDFCPGTAFVLGSEHQGLTEPWLAACDAVVRIPMLGKADSLNVSASTAVILYEARRQRSSE